MSVSFGDATTALAVSERRGEIQDKSAVGMALINILWHKGRFIFIYTRGRAVPNYWAVSNIVLGLISIQ